MDEHDRRKEELLEELARRFRDSAHTLKSVARRINEASQAHKAVVRRLESADRDLRASVGASSGPLAFSYVEYLEFSSAEEFRKFKRMGAITDEEIAAVDLDELTAKLQE